MNVCMYNNAYDKMYMITDKDKPNAIINTCVAKLKAVRSIIKQIWQPYENKFVREDIEAENEISKVDYNTGMYMYVWVCRYFMTMMLILFIDCLLIYLLQCSYKSGWRLSNRHIHVRYDHAHGLGC